MVRANPEDRRVKFPALAHLTRLGYKYLCAHKLKTPEIGFDPYTLICHRVLRESLERVNNRPVSDSAFDEILRLLQLMLDSEDLGEKFTRALRDGVNDWKLIDFDNLANNHLNIATELIVKNKDTGTASSHKFSPDIVIFVNGLPVSFIEVKRENNLRGVQGERERMDQRSRIPGFRSFLNMMQFVSFSNNLEYNDNEQTPSSGGFYTAVNQGKHQLNHMRDEEDSKIVSGTLPMLSGDAVNTILEDNNLLEIKADSDFKERLSPLTPANSFITSLYRPDRLFFLLRYGVAYRKEQQTGGLLARQKHVMRYPQIFATQAITKYLRKGHSKGVIWHTQGSGKTALTYYNVKHLTDYYQRQNTVAQFFFIVDRIDLALQAKAEFEARGLEVILARSRKEFVDITSQIAPLSSSGKQQITVVNIQKFTDESKLGATDYAANIQRVYFIDEAHRSYNPRGSFLANLITSDKNAVIIALTGTPLLKNDRATREVFGDYIHTYYYNQSIADGYTLRLMREDIKTEYKQQLSEALRSIVVKLGSTSLVQIKEHPKYIAPLADYIAADLIDARARLRDDSIGGMVVCCSTKQARELYERLQQAHPELEYGLVLHDEGDKKLREDIVAGFKSGKTDMLIVYNMLLTGFDAPRLKRLYLERLVMKHNLLQTLTRANRPYREHSFGSVIDFADISDEFKKTSQEYLNELGAQLGSQWGKYNQVIISEEEIRADIQKIREAIWDYNLSDISVFIDQINSVEDRDEIKKIVKALKSYLALYNQVRLQADDSLLQHLTVENARQALREVLLRAQTLAAIDAAAEGDYSQIIDMALQHTHFEFKKLSETELQVADEMIKIAERAYVERERNTDPKDPEYIALIEDFNRVFRQKDFRDLTAQEIEKLTIDFEKYRKKFKEINSRNQRIASQYQGDRKFLRVHKRIKEAETLKASNIRLVELLNYVKTSIDDTIANNESQLENLSFFERHVQHTIAQACEQPAKIDYSPQIVKHIASLVSSEYTHDIRMSA